MSKSTFYQEEAGVLVQINYNWKSINIIHNVLIYERSQRRTDKAVHHIIVWLAVVDSANSPIWTLRHSTLTFLLLHFALIVDFKQIKIVFKA